MSANVKWNSLPSATQDEVFRYFSVLIEKKYREVSKDSKFLEAFSEAFDIVAQVLLEMTKFPDEALVFEDITRNAEWRVYVVDFSKNFSKIECVYFNVYTGETVHQTISGKYFVKNFSPETTEAEILDEMITGGNRRRKTAFDRYVVGRAKKSPAFAKAHREAKKKN